uniref:1-acylglycerol-3-phosphate O-acyltransferase n=1 Tax=Plectus sambesii TaxID=2011161 RepID=A0A914XRQ1_9BILA
MLTTLAEWCTSFILVLFIIVPLLWQVSKQFRFYVKITLYYFMILLAGCIGFVLCLPFGVTTDNHFRVFWFFRCCTGWTGITYELRNGENLISDKPYILAANHQSSIDVLGK